MIKIFLKNYLKILSLLTLERIATKMYKKNAENFCCKICDFNTYKNSNFEIHLKTKKHLSNILATSSNISATKKMNVCENCNKSYNDRSGLWRHKKTCKPYEQIDKSDDIQIENINELNDKDLIMMLIKQNSDLIKENSEFKNMMMKVFENGTNNNQSHNTNSLNKTFNLQFFLNETCKDAMNIMDFVESIQLQLSDLEKVGELGYVEGISNIIVKNLKALDVTQRPVHCTDKKRETLYIKDENKWEKEDDEKKKIRKAIKKVACKNQRLIPKFKEAHPDCIKAASKFSDQYNKMIIESMGGSGDNDLEKEDKIIKNISKQIIIEK
jgi:hypothetical protein